MKGWIGVDLDGTLAVHTDGHGGLPIGPPIGPMLERVQNWLAEGQEVRIVTARVARDFDHDNTHWMAISKWVKEHLGVYLSITSEKDPGMIELWDDRAVEVVRNVGEPARACANCVAYEQE